MKIMNPRKQNRMEWEPKVEDRERGRGKKRGKWREREGREEREKEVYGRIFSFEIALSKDNPSCQIF